MTSVVDSLYSSLTKLLHPTNPQLAQVVGVLYAIGPSPAVMTSPYTEPAFAALTFTGLWLVENAHTAARQVRAGAQGHEAS